ncbi:MAG: hypothetical protein HY290_31715 [Planctomycetia bacterium]|nr:hypothetical protein [Planctomycetia bacterium]
MTVRAHAAFGAAASLAVLCAIVWGFVLAGSPSTRRRERVDDQRLHDLQAIAAEIQSLVVTKNGKRELKEPIPRTLDDAVTRARGTKLNPRDPETGEPYRYTVKNETTFELCARFTTRRDSDWHVFWNHPAGDHCFTINVLDPPP